MCHEHTIRDYNNAMSAISILALDTSGEFCSIALYRNSRGTEHVVSRHIHTGAVSSTHVLPLVREVLDAAGIGLGDCHAIAFGAGPGSFTGLRTACGVAQGLAYGAGLPVVPVGTLMACAEQARLAHAAALRTAARVVVALDARMDEAYWADYAWDAANRGWIVRHDAALDAPEAIPVPDEPFVLAGNAAAMFGARLALTAHAATMLPDALPHAEAVARLGAQAFINGQAMAASDAAPLYVRNKVAQTVAERQAVAAERSSLARQAEGR